jgi:hypothetical protein
LETPGKVKRMPHACSPANNYYIGFETCNPKTLRFNSNHTKFTVDAKDLPAAKAYVAACYDNAVELFAKLCKFHGKDPLADGIILSHKEAGARGIASQHGDIEGLWNGLGMGYTMDGFRADVAKKIEEDNDMTREQTNALIQAAVAPLSNRINEQNQEIKALRAENAAMQQSQAALADQLRAAMSAEIDAALDAALGPNIGHLSDAPKWLQKDLAELLEYGIINGGTPAAVDPTDVHKRQAILEAVLMAKRCDERYAQSLLLPNVNQAK